MLVGKDLGPFRIVSELGSGAMGSVYRGVRRDNGKHFAIKMIALGLLGSEKAVERFEREGEILKQLKHPNIVRYAGTGSWKKTPFFIMEYIEGESLDKMLLRRGAFPWDEVVVLGRQLCAALKHAHEKGIVHRDLKPSNLMIQKEGTLKLTDFGIAKDADLSTLTGTNCTVGTAAYMSPEQCRGEKHLAPKSDLYSMGVVFYELLTGRKPFQADSPVEMFQAHVFATFERPSRFVMDIPVWLDTLVCQLLEKKPEHRPFDAAMVAKVLDEVEQKVADQRSAGVDAATIRGRSRPTDETDRAAARTIRTAVAKTKFRKKAVPWTQRKWVQAVMLSSALVGLAALVFLLTRPPAADKLYRAVQTAVEAKDYPAAMDAANRYLRFYGSRDDEATGQVRAWDQAVRTERREEQLHNRIYGRFKSKPEGDIEKLAYQAIEQEDAGDVQDAALDWQKLQSKVEESGSADAAVYGWVAEKKLAKLAALPRREQQLAETLDYENALKQVGSKPDLGRVEQSSVEALRFERFGDLPAARDHWEAIRDRNLKYLDDRGWAILAAVHAKVMKAKAVSGAEKEREFRDKLLADRLAEAEAVPHSADPHDRRRALAICRDIVALYSQDSDSQVKASARKAAQLLAERKWEG